MGTQVLIVDDSRSMRQMVNFTLTENGYDVTEAENGKDGLEKLGQIQPELIITDINMPEMDGIEIIKQVRGMGDYKFVPIIVLTTESEAGKQAEGQQAGATAWIVKPFTPEKLIEVAKKVGG